MASSRSIDPKASQAQADAGRRFLQLHPVIAEMSQREFLAWRIKNPDIPPSAWNAVRTALEQPVSYEQLEEDRPQQVSHDQSHGNVGSLLHALAGKSDQKEHNLREEEAKKRIEKVEQVVAQIEQQVILKPPTLPEIETVEKSVTADQSSRIQTITQVSKEELIQRDVEGKLDAALTKTKQKHQAAVALSVSSAPSLTAKGKPQPVSGWLFVSAIAIQARQKDITKPVTEEFTVTHNGKQVTTTYLQQPYQESYEDSIRGNIRQQLGVNNKATGGIRVLAISKGIIDQDLKRIEEGNQALRDHAAFEQQRDAFIKAGGDAKKAPKQTAKPLQAEPSLNITEMFHAQVGTGLEIYKQHLVNRLLERGEAGQAIWDQVVHATTIFNAGQAPQPILPQTLSEAKQLFAPEDTHPPISEEEIARLLSGDHELDALATQHGGSTTPPEYTGLEGQKHKPAVSESQMSEQSDQVITGRASTKPKPLPPPSKDEETPERRGERDRLSPLNEHARSDTSPYVSNEAPVNQSQRQSLRQRFQMRRTTQATGIGSPAPLPNASFRNVFRSFFSRTSRGAGATTMQFFKRLAGRVIKGGLKLAAKALNLIPGIGTALNAFANFLIDHPKLAGIFAIGAFLLIILVGGVSLFILTGGLNDAETPEGFDITISADATAVDNPDEIVATAVETTAAKKTINYTINVKYPKDKGVIVTVPIPPEAFYRNGSASPPPDEDLILSRQADPRPGGREGTYVYQIGWRLRNPAAANTLTFTLAPAYPDKVIEVYATAELVDSALNVRLSADVTEMNNPGQPDVVGPVQNEIDIQAVSPKSFVTYSLSVQSPQGSLVEVAVPIPPVARLKTTGSSPYDFSESSVIPVGFPNAGSEYVSKIGWRLNDQTAARSMTFELEPAVANQYLEIQAEANIVGGTTPPGGGTPGIPPDPGASTFAELMTGQGRNTGILGDENSFVTKTIDTVARRAGTTNTNLYDPYLRDIYRLSVERNVNPLIVLTIWGVEQSFAINGREFGCKPFDNGFDEQVRCSRKTLDDWMADFEAKQASGILPVPNIYDPSCTYTDNFIYAYEMYTPVCWLNDGNSPARENFVIIFKEFLYGRQ